eukprot:891055-Heterocapsa_arctica.AAC.1
MVTSRWVSHPRVGISRVPAAQQISRCSSCASRALGSHPRWVPSHEPAQYFEHNSELLLYGSL